MFVGLWGMDPSVTVDSHDRDGFLYCAHSMTILYVTRISLLSFLFQRKLFSFQKVFSNNLLQNNFLLCVQWDNPLTWFTFLVILGRYIHTILYIVSYSMHNFAVFFFLYHLFYLANNCSLKNCL